MTDTTVICPWSIAKRMRIKRIPLSLHIIQKWITIDIQSVTSGLTKHEILADLTQFLEFRWLGYWG